MKLTAEGLPHMIPSHHVLRVGQTVQMDSTAPAAKANHRLPSPAELAVSQCDRELEMSLENLNQLILELDPTFEPLPVPKSPTSDEDSPVLIPRGCSGKVSPGSVRAHSPSIPIPSGGRLSPQGSLVFSGPCSSALPPLPSGSVGRRSPIPRQDGGASGRSSWTQSQQNRNSALSFLSSSSCSDTSYIMGSNLSLTSEGSDSLDSNLLSPHGFFISANRSLSPKNKHLQGLHEKGVHSSPASLAGSFTDIPVLLVNGEPRHEIQTCPPRPGMQLDSLLKTSSTFSLNCSQPSMKFVMDTSKQWFRSQISRAEAEAMVKNKDPGTFVIRDSTSFKGSFGMALKVDQSPTTFAASAKPGDNCSDMVRHFLIESSAKGVRIKGSSQEPYFGSLPALVYQHTISACSLPCRLLLSSEELAATEGNNSPTEDKKKTASNFVYLNAVPTEMLTGPCAVQKAVTVTFNKAPGSFTPAIVNMKVLQKGITLTDINRKLFFRRHYPNHLLSYSGEDPDNRRWVRGSDFGAKMFGFVAKGVEAGAENVCHVFAEYDPLQPCNDIVDFIQATITKT